jgi:uridine kinase
MTRELIVVDGRSGSGKTAWAAALSAELGFEVLSLDELYPGWDGLDAGQAFASRTLIPLWMESGEITVPQWDWSKMSYSSTRHLRSPEGLILEGCGALSAFSAQWAHRTVWLSTSDEERYRRAIARDGDTYRPHWQRWARQEERFIALHRSPTLAREQIST